MSAVPDREFQTRLSHNEQRLARSEEMIKNLGMDVAELSKAVAEQGRQTSAAIQHLTDQMSTAIGSLSDKISSKEKINWQAVGAIFVIIAAIGSGVIRPIYVSQEHSDSEIIELNLLTAEQQKDIKQLEISNAKTKVMLDIALDELNYPHHKDG